MLEWAVCLSRQDLLDLSTRYYIYLQVGDTMHLMSLRVLFYLMEDLSNEL